MSREYVCDSCKEIITSPHDVKMKEFYIGCSFEVDGVHPSFDKRKVKTHLCDKCFHGLRKTGEKTEQEWIPADVELPGQKEVEKYYQQYGEHPKYIVMIAGAVQSTVLAFDGEDFYDDNAGEIYKVTHWMPLPAAPNNKK